MKGFCLGALVLASLAAAACGGPAVAPDGTARVQGEVIFDERHGPASADVVEVVLLDVADPDSRVGPLGRERIDDPEGRRVPFALAYSVRSVRSGHRYALCARALDASGNITWQTERLESVGLPTDQQLPVRMTRDRGAWADCRWQ